MTIKQKETKNKCMNIKTSVYLILIGSILFAFSCNPPVVDVGINPSAPGAVTDLAVVDESIENTSFVVQWTAPEETGTKEDGTALTPDEVEYRSYYVVRTEDQTSIPSAQSIKENPNTETQPLTKIPQSQVGVFNAKQEGLLSNTRYFVIVASYNSSSPELETLSSTVLEVDTKDESTPPGAVTNFTIDTSTIKSGEFKVRWVGPEETGTGPDGTALTPEEVGYRIYYVAGTEDQELSAATIRENLDSLTQIKQVKNTMSTIIFGLTPETHYSVTIASYNTLAPQLATASNEVKTAKTSAADDLNFEKTLAYEKGEGTFYDAIEEEYRYTFGFETPQMIIPDPNTVSSVVGDAVISYSLEKDGDGPDFILASSTSNEAAIGIVSGGALSDGTTVDDTIADGTIIVNPTANTGTVTYLVRVSAVGYNTQSVPLTITVVPAEFTGTLAYDQETYSYTFGFETQTISPDTILSAGEGTVINYSLMKDEGDDFILASSTSNEAAISIAGDGTINDDTIADGTIIVNPTTDVGTATYTVRAEATGYNSQSVTLTITVVPAEFTGTLAYGTGTGTSYDMVEEDYRYIIGFETPQTISPDADTMLSAGEGVVINYSLMKDEGDDFILDSSTSNEAAIGIVSGGTLNDGTIVDDTIADGTIIVNPTTDIGSATYTVRAEATGHNSQSVTLTITVVLAEFTGTLAYGIGTYSYNFLGFETPKTISPDTDTMLSAGAGVEIKYILEKDSGVDFIQDSSQGNENEAAIGIDEDSGIITVNPTTDAGTVTYTVRAEADGYATKEASLTITVNASDFDGDLAYDPVTYEYIQGSQHTITPESKPTKPADETRSVTIRYSLTKSLGVEFTPNAPDIDDVSGVITIYPTDNIGSATYTVRAEAGGHNPKEVTITIVIIENVNAGKVGVSMYYSAGETTDIIPVGLGQAIADDSSSAFALGDNDVILTISSLDEFDTTGLVGNYTISFGPTTDNYTGNYEKLASDKSLQILKSELEANSFPFDIDEAVISISGPSITGTPHVATYLPEDIYDSRDLQAMRIGLERAYELKRNIEFPSVNANESNYEAVGTNDDPFTGSLGGAIYTISGIQIESDTPTAYQGIFGVMQVGAVEKIAAQNLELKNFKITGSAYAGYLAGWIKQGTVDNVHGEVDDANAGKVVVSDVSGFGGGLFGLAGTAPPTNTGGGEVRIQNTSSAVTVSGGTTSSYIGGLIGYTGEDVKLTDSSATGAVTGENSVGGLVGHSKEGAVSNSYAIGSVTGSNFLIGGLVGNNEGGPVPRSYATGDVTGSNSVGGLVGRNSNQGKVIGYATGNVIGSNEDIGGLVGDNRGAFITGNAIGNVEGKSKVGGLVGFNDGDASVSVSYATGDVRGSGDRVGGLVGSNEGYVAGYATGPVIAEGAATDEGKTNDHVGGLVGYNANYGAVTGYATGPVTGSGDNVGGLVGYNKGSADGYATGSVTGSSKDVGGLVGLNEGTATGYATSDVIGSGDNVGGLVGNNSGTARGYATGPATGSVTGSGDNVGGLVGNNSGTATGYATRNVEGSSNVGGLAGNNSGTARGYATGDVTGSGDNVGGLAGYNSSMVTGYARGIIRRSGGTSLGFGNTIGNAAAGTHVSYSSSLMTESQVYDGETGTTAFANADQRTGADGTEVTVDDTTTQTTFSNFVFSTTSGEWTWVAGNWPAINIGDDIKSADEQPITP